jgi:ABC-type Fe3+ transport system substrate-binding protein
MSKTKGGKKITIYASMGVRRGISDLLWAFRRRYTLEEFPAYLDDHPFPVLKRVEAELKNGLNTADVVIAPHYLLMQMKHKGLLANYCSDAQPSFAYDDSKTWSAIGVTSMFPVYSERVDSEAPESIAELSAKRWKNQIASQAILTSSAGNLTAYYLMALRRILGEKRWREVIGIVGRVNPATYDCIDHLLQALEAGEKSIALAAYSLAYYRLKEEGAHLKQLQVDELPRLYTFTSAGLLKNSEDSVSAHHFLDFLFSKEGQTYIGKIWGILPLNSREMPNNWRKNFFPTELEVKDVEKNSKILAKMGLQ